VETLVVDPEAVFRRLARPDRVERAKPGRRARSRAARRRGKYTRHRLAGGGDLDVALDATVRAAALRVGRGRVAVEAVDLRSKVREHRSPYSICFVVDNSWSVHAERMVEKVKGLVLGLLENATSRGDTVALVAFKGGVPEATVVLSPTSSAALAKRRLRSIPLSGQTPLADALRRARVLLRQELIKHPNAVPLVVAITDGMPTVPLARGGDPFADALAEACALRRARVALVVAEVPGGDGGAPRLARACAGVCLPFERVAGEAGVAGADAA
jgi:magnesium chelatase subunit D